MKLYKEFKKLIILFFNKIIIFKDLFTLIIIVTIVKVENIK